MPFRIGWFSTGRDAAARDLFNAAHSAMLSESIPAQISYVFCNRKKGEAAESDRFIQLIGSAKLPLVTFSSADFQPGLRQHPGEPKTSDEWRRSYHHEVIEQIADLDADICVLAGYMLIVSAEMCQRLRMINLHPAMPGGPAGTWQEVITEQIRSRAPEAGAMIHLVTAELDQGPPIAYFTIPIQSAELQPYWREIESLPRTPSKPDRRRIEQTKLFQEIRRQQAVREIPLLLETLKKLATGEIALNSYEGAVSGEKPAGAVCLNEEIEAVLAAATGPHPG